MCSQLASWELLSGVWERAGKSDATKGIVQAVSIPPPIPISLPLHRMSQWRGGHFLFPSAETLVGGPLVTEERPVAGAGARRGRHEKWAGDFPCINGFRALHGGCLKYSTKSTYTIDSHCTICDSLHHLQVIVDSGPMLQHT